MNKHFMLDLETTGTDLKNDAILEIGLVEIEYKYPYWHLTGREFHKVLHYAGEPTTAFAKQHMKKLYKQCNEQDPSITEKSVSQELKEFIHYDELVYLSAGMYELPKVTKPKFFMGWNASVFDVPLVTREMLTNCWHHQMPDGKEELRGDVHYRVYEQTGALNIVEDVTGLGRKTVLALATDLNPTGLKLPEGKDHTAIYDCYKQIINMNGMIAILRQGIKR